MTLHHVEHEERVPQAHSNEANILYLPLDTIVALYSEEVAQGEYELQDVILEIEEVKRQLYEQLLRMNDRREVMAINLGVGENEIMITPSAKEKLYEEQLFHQLSELKVIRRRIEDAIETSRINRIRHDEEINRRLFSTATRTSY
jgi:hypothetical protein